MFNKLLILLCAAYVVVLMNAAWEFNRRYWCAHPELALPLLLQPDCRKGK